MGTMIPFPPRSPARGPFPFHLLFVLGYFEEHGDEAPAYYVRDFYDGKRRVSYGFTSFVALRRFFEATPFSELRYFVATAPLYLDILCGIRRDLVVNPRSKAELHVPVTTLADVYADAKRRRLPGFTDEE